MNHHEYQVYDKSIEKLVKDYTAVVGGTKIKTQQNKKKNEKQNKLVQQQAIANKRKESVCIQKHAYFKSCTVLASICL